MKLKWNANGAIAGGHLRAFRVADDKADQIGARLDVETGFQGESGAAEAVDGLVEQLHFDNFFTAGDEIAVLIKNGGGHGEIVAIAAIGFTKANAFDVDVHEDGQARLGRIFLKELRLHIDGQVVDFVLRKERFLNFFLGGLNGIGNGAGREVAVARLHAEFLFASEGNLEVVIRAIDFEVLGGEAQQVGDGGGGDGFAQAFIDVIAIVEEGTAGAIG